MRRPDSRERLARRMRQLDRRYELWPFIVPAVVAAVLCFLGVWLWWR